MTVYDWALAATLIWSYGVLVAELVLFPIPSEASAHRLWKDADSTCGRFIGLLPAVPAAALFGAVPLAAIGEIVLDTRQFARPGAQFFGLSSPEALWAPGAAEAILFIISLATVCHLIATLVLRHATDLVDHGPFAYSRNPIALGLMVTALGWGLLLNHPVTAVGGAYTVMYLHLKVRIEEQAVARQFGAAYGGYSSRVSRYIGRRAKRSR